jgi:hypothetical protein
VADKKETQLSIVLRTVDRATAGIRAVAARLDAITKPFKDFKTAFGDLRESSGLDQVAGGLKGVGSALGDVLSKLALVGGLAGAALAGVLHLVEGFDDLGDKAEAMGVTVDWLAQMRAAADESGSSVEALDKGMQGFVVQLGMARAGTGKLAAFLKATNNPALMASLKAAKSNEEAFDLVADAMSKLTDPAKKAAAAQKIFGDASLAPLLTKGSTKIKELRDEYLKTNGSMQGAVDAAGGVDGAMKKLHVATQGVKAALVEGLGPAIEDIVKQLAAWLTGHREDIKQWAEDIGKKLPGAVDAVVEAVSDAVDFVLEFVDAIGGWKNAALAVVAVMLGPLIKAVVSLGITLMTTPIGWVIAGLAAITAALALCGDGFRAVIPAIVAVGAALLGMPGVAIVSGIVAAATLVIEHWEPIAEFFGGLWEGVKDVFSQALDFIMGIVDKVVDAVNTVKDAIGTVFESSSIADEALARAKGERPASEVIGRTVQNMSAIRASSEAKVTIELPNAPRGTRANIDPRSTADVSTNVGNQMFPGLFQ